MSSGLVLAGLGLAAIGIGGRLLSRHMPKAAQAFEQTLKSLPTSQETWANSKYYKGGFEPKMSRREASLILGVSPNAQVFIFYILTIFIENKMVLRMTKRKNYYKYPNL